MTRDQDYPTSVIAQRVKLLRRERGFSAERLAEEMDRVGVPFDKTVVANLETGRRRYVTVQELFALALVLDASPMHLLARPDEPDDPYLVTPTVPNSQRVVRGWLAGRRPLHGQDFNRFVSAVPSSDPDGFWPGFQALREEVQGKPDAG